MKKNAYMAPEMEIVEIIEQSVLMVGSVDNEGGGGWSPNPPPGKGNNCRSYEDED